MNNSTEPLVGYLSFARYTRTNTLYKCENKEIGVSVTHHGPDSLFALAAIEAGQHPCRPFYTQWPDGSVSIRYSSLEQAAAKARKARDYWAKRNESKADG